MLGVFKVVWRLTNLGANDVCQLLWHPVCNGLPTGHDGSKGDAIFVYFGEAIKLLGDSTSGVHFPVAAVTESPCLFDVPKCLCQFVFKFGSRVHIDDPVSTGVS